MSTYIKPIAILLIGLLVLGTALPCRACFSLVVGKEASADGHVIMAHNEDDGPPQVVNHHKVPRRRHAQGSKVTLRNGGQLDQVACTWAFIWSEMPGMLFSDSYVNEWGVCITSDNCPSREDRTELTDGGIGFLLRRLVAERAQSAREGVTLAGRLVERFGYIASGRTYIISDPGEGWLFCAVKGKRWLARRVPDREVAFVANTYTIGCVDLSDRDNVLASDDIVTYAETRAWYKPERDGPFNFAAVYASPQAARHPSNRGRQWQGLSYVSAAPVDFTDELPFSLVPRNKVSVSDVMQILRHTRDTKLPTTLTAKACPPQGSCRICSNATQTSFVAHLRDDLSPDIGVVYWMCLAPPETSLFMPYYLGITSFPPGFATESVRPSRKVFNERVKALFQSDPHQAFWTFSNFRQKIAEDERRRMHFQQTAQDFEAKALERLASRDKKAQQLYQQDKRMLEKHLTQFSQDLYQSALEVLETSLAE